MNPLDVGCKCLECPFAINKSAKSPVWGEGSSNPQGILIGEFPTREDATAGRPFVGQVGQQLGEVLEGNKLPRTSLFLAHAILCQPSNQAWKDPKLFKQAMECCAPSLKFQLHTFPSNTPVLSLGKWAQRALMNRQLNLNKSRGFIRWDWRISSD